MDIGFDKGNDSFFLKFAQDISCLFLSKISSLEIDSYFKWYAKGF